MEATPPQEACSSRAKAGAAARRRSILETMSWRSTKCTQTLSPQRAARLSTKPNDARVQRLRSAFLKRGSTASSRNPSFADVLRTVMETVKTKKHLTMEELRRQKVLLFHALSLPPDSKSARDVELIVTEFKSLEFYSNFSDEVLEQLALASKLSIHTGGQTVAAQGQENEDMRFIYFGSLAAHPHIDAHAQLLNGTTTSSDASAESLPQRSGAVMFLKGDVVGLGAFSRKGKRDKAFDCTLVAGLHGAITISIDAPAYRQIFDMGVFDRTDPATIAWTKNTAMAIFELPRTQRNAMACAVASGFLRRFPFFYQFDDTTIQHMARRFRVKHRATEDESGTWDDVPVSGDEVASASSSRQCMNFLVSGRISSTPLRRQRQTTADSKTSAVRTDATVHVSGDAFGYTGKVNALGHAYRTLKGPTGEDTVAVVLELEKEDFDSLIAPLMRKKGIVFPMGSCRHSLRRSPSQRTEKDVTIIHELLGCVKGDFISHLEMPRQRMLCRSIQLEDFSQGQLVCMQGDSGDAFYVIVSGAAAVHINRTGLPRRTRKQEQGIPTHRRHTADIGRSIHLMTPGEGFGEKSLLFSIPRSATIVAEEWTFLIVVHKQEYEAMLSDDVELSPALSVEVLASTDRTSAVDPYLANYLAKFRFFHRFPKPLLVPIVPGITLRKFDKGHTFFDEGDDTSFVYVVFAGTVELRRSNDSGNPQAMARTRRTHGAILVGQENDDLDDHEREVSSEQQRAQEPADTQAGCEPKQEAAEVITVSVGDAFGEYSSFLQLHQPRLYRARCQEECRVFVIDAQHVRDHWLPVEDAAAALESEACRKILRKPAEHRSEEDIKAIRKAVGAQTFMAQLSESTQTAVCKVLQLVDVAPGELICRQGDAGDCLYIIFSGEAEVYIEGLELDPEDHTRRVNAYGVHVATVRHGSVVGEKALSTGRPRDATLLCRKWTELMRLDRMAFERILRHIEGALAFRPEEMAARALELYEESKEDTTKKEPLTELFYRLVGASGCFKHAVKSEAKKALECFIPVQLTPGSQLFKASETPSHVFLLVLGTVKEKYQGTNTKEFAHTAKELQTSLLGTVATSWGCPHLSTVTATSKCFALALTRDDYFKGWATTYGRAFNETCRLVRENPAFTVLSDIERAILLHSSKRTECSGGSIVVPNEVRDRVFLITSGCFELLKLPRAKHGTGSKKGIQFASPLRRSKVTSVLATISRGNMIGEADLPKVSEDAQVLDFIYRCATDGSTLVEFQLSKIPEKGRRFIRQDVSKLIAWNLAHHATIQAHSRQGQADLRDLVSGEDDPNGWAGEDSAEGPSAEAAGRVKMLSTAGGKIPVAGTTAADKTSVQQAHTMKTFGSAAGNVGGTSRLSLGGSMGSSRLSLRHSRQLSRASTGHARDDRSIATRASSKSSMLSTRSSRKSVGPRPGTNPRRTLLFSPFRPEKTTISSQGKKLVMRSPVRVTSKNGQVDLDGLNIVV